eukprot:6156056-Heterocapsa_arctica.AAC.1
MCQNNLLTILRRRKENQYHYRSVQSTEKGKTDKKHIVSHPSQGPSQFLFSESDQLMAEPVTPAPPAMIRGQLQI